jgi:opacity protein-like surface antigen
VALAVAGARVAAADPLGLYLGGSVGQSQVEADSGGNIASPYDHFRANHSAYKITVGLRPLPFFGAELSYVDLGHPGGAVAGAPADVSESGTAAFAMLYLPVPVIDLYAKAGVARLQSTVNGNTFEACAEVCLPTLVPFRVERTDTGFAGGLGAQLKFGAWAVRAEYEVFSAAGRNPALASIGANWSF